MNRGVHNIDDLFRSLLEGYEELPSSSVLENIDAALDKKKAELYKKRFIFWKRTAIVLLFLLIGFALFEAGIIKSNSTISNTNNGANKITISEKNKFNSPLNPAINKTMSEKQVHYHDESLAKDLSNKELELNNKLYNRDKDQKIHSVFNSISQNSNYNKESQDYTQLRQVNSIIYLPENIRPLIPGFNLNSILKTVGQSSINISKYQHSFFKDSLFNITLTKNNPRENRKDINHYWALSAFYSYDFMNYRLDNDLSAVKTIKQSEAHEPSFSTGLLLTRHLKKEWSLQSGLIYSNTQIGISPQKMFALQNGNDVSYKYITSSGYAYIKPSFGPQPSVGDSLTTAQAKHTLQFLSIPLVIKHRFGLKKVAISPGVGAEANFLTSAKLETELLDASNLENVTINKLKGTRSFYWSVTANAEIQYKVNNKIAVNLRPSFRYAVSPITKNNVVETYPYNFGIGLGIKVHL